MGGNRRTAPRLRFEPLEERSLLSGLLVALQSHVARPSAAQVADLAATRVAAQATPTASTTNQSGLYSGNGSANSVDMTPSGPNATAPIPLAPLLGMGTPTKAELAREKFFAHFSGPMTTLAPRFSDQSKILYLHGLGGSSPKFFLHGDYALAMSFPAGFDPRTPGGSPAVLAPDGVTVVKAAVPPVTGFTFLDDKNNNSGGTVGLDLSADPTSFDAQGRPTRLFFTSDPNIYSGIFYISQSAGVVTIQYGKNTASASFNGRLYVTGLTSPFQNVLQYARHSG